MAIKLFLLNIVLLSIFSLSCKDQNLSTAVSEKNDTCFYQLKIPPNIDMPSTPHFDTTIVVNENCKENILQLQAWGTETKYHFSSSNGISKSIRFSNGEKGVLNLNELPKGKYNGSLMACGNGGSFTLNIK